MLDLQTIEQRANARTAAQPATSATPATRDDPEDAAGSKVAGVAAVAAAHAHARPAGIAATSATPATRDDPEDAAGSKVAGVAGVAGDERVRCGSCSHYAERTRRCRNHRRAGLRSPLLGLDLPEMLQRCQGFVPGPSGASPNVGHCEPDA
jgi:hypothetical protein